MIEFYKAQLKHWQAVRHQASVDGNFKAWESANKEVENYAAMLKAAGGEADDVVDS